MEGFHKDFKTCIAAKLVLGVILSLILTPTAWVRNSQAQRGFCWPYEGLAGCCSENDECGAGQECLFNYRGVCISEDYIGSPCNRGYDCAEGGVCFPVGECHDGKPCTNLTTYGLCIDDAFKPCFSAEDCNQGLCVPACLLYPPLCLIADFCEDGPCLYCAGGCYIATATMGTELEEKTDVLRSFRDKYLLSNAAGRKFVAAYYKYSPPLADYMTDRKWLRSLVRILLLPIIGLVSMFV